MHTGKLNRLIIPGWIQRAAERRERRRSRRVLVAKHEVPQTVVELHPAEPNEEPDDLTHLDQGEQSDGDPTKDDGAEGGAVS